MAKAKDFTISQLSRRGRSDAAPRPLLHPLALHVLADQALEVLGLLLLGLEVLEDVRLSDVP